MIVLNDAIAEFLVELGMDLLIQIGGQIPSFCPDQHDGKLLTLIMLDKLTQSL